MSNSSLKNLYPGLPDEDLEQIDDVLSRYLELALQIFERIRSDPELYAKFRDLTATEAHSSMHAKTSNPS